MDDDKVVLECPNCHSRISPDDYRGKNEAGYFEWLCPRCQNQFISRIGPSLNKYFEIRNSLLGEVDSFFKTIQVFINLQEQLKVKQIVINVRLK